MIKTGALKVSLKQKERKTIIPKSTMIVWKKERKGNNNNNKERNDDDDICKPLTAFDIFNISTKNTSSSFITCCNKEMDELLKKGVELGCITEFCGLSGTGKTQLGLQLACDVQLPSSLGGVGGQCIYIDTANGVVGQRIFNISKSFTNHIHQMAQKRESRGGNDYQSLLQRVKNQIKSEKDMLSNILFFRCFDFKDLDNILMEKLEKILSGNDKKYSKQFNNVKLIIIDPISHLIKYQENMVQYLLKCGQLFHYLCKTYNVAIVCMNQMTTKMSVGDNNNNNNKQNTKNKKYNFYDDEYDNFDAIPIDAKYIIVPGLGHVWTSLINVRVQLFMINETRYAKLLKTNKCIKTNQSAPFKISNGGIRNLKTKIRH